MRYDPFATNDSLCDETSESTSTVPRFSKLDQRPGILNVPLTSLEWKGESLGADVADSNQHQKRPRGVSSGNDSERVSTPLAPEPEIKTKVVEKIVERVVRVPVEEPLTIMGVPALVDDRVRNLVNFILQHVTQPGVEVEAKLGVLIEKYKDVRACDLLPTLCESPLQADIGADTRFEAAVHHSYFAHLNTELNRRVEATSSLPNASERVMYLRTRELDFFWPNKVRETRRMTGNAPNGAEKYETIRVQRKTRLGDLNFLCPSSVLDVRYSASLEADAPPPPPSATDPAKRRLKDRISYKFDVLSVDITAVETTDPGANLFNHPTHEIEIEIDSSASLFTEVEKYKNGDPSSQLFRIATTLVNTVRIIMEEARRAVALAESVPPYEQRQMNMYQAPPAIVHQPPALEIDPQKQHENPAKVQLPPAQHLVAQADMQSRNTHPYSTI